MNINTDSSSRVRKGMVIYMLKRLRTSLNKNMLIGACIHWLLSFFTDRLVFHYSLWDISDLTAVLKTVMAWGSKIAFLFVLIVLWQFFYWFMKKANRAFVRYSLIYFGMMLVFILMTWPGIWRMDEFGILFEAQNIFPVFWQNYLTSVFYIIALMLLPAPAGIIIVQNACIALIIGSLLTMLETLPIWKKPLGKMVYLGYIPFLLFPVLDSNLNPMRMSLYAYLELYLFAQLLYTAFTANSIKLNSMESKSMKIKGENSSKELVMKPVVFWKCIILSAIVITWRAESIYYLILIPLCYIALYYKESKKVKSRFVLILIISSVILLLPQKIGEKLTSSQNYDLTSVLLPIVPLVGELTMEAVLSSHVPESYEAALHEPDRPESKLMILDRVIDVSMAFIASAEGRSGINLFWSEPDFVRNYTDEEYNQFKKVYYKLIMEYLDVFIKERMDTFVSSSDLLENTTEIYTKSGVSNYEKFQVLFLNKPISNKLRTTVISILEMRSMSDYNQKRTGYGFVYHCIIPLCISVLMCVWMLIKRRWSYAFVLGAHLLKVPLIFLTAPSRLFMYYYPIYLFGAALGVMVLMYIGFGCKREVDNGKHFKND